MEIIPSDVWNLIFVAYCDYKDLFKLNTLSTRFGRQWLEDAIVNKLKYHKTSNTHYILNDIVKPNSHVYMNDYTLGSEQYRIVADNIVMLGIKYLLKTGITLGYQDKIIFGYTPPLIVLAPIGPVGVTGPVGAIGPTGIMSGPYYYQYIIVDCDDDNNDNKWCLTKYILGLIQNDTKNNDPKYNYKLIHYQHTSNIFNNHLLFELYDNGYSKGYIQFVD